MRRQLAFGAAVIVLLMAPFLAAQTIYRLKGVTRTVKGAVTTSIAAEAVTGYRGEQFIGQKTLASESNEKGEWTLLGLTAGVWMFTASAPGTLPAVAVLPVKFAQRQMQSAQGGQLIWSLPLWLVSAEEVPALAPAAPLIAEGRSLEALQLLAPALAPDATPIMQCAAGQMALAIKQTGGRAAALRRGPESRAEKRLRADGSGLGGVPDQRLGHRVEDAVDRARPGAPRAEARAGVGDRRASAGDRFEVTDHHNRAAPRTPLESPCRALTRRVCTSSENTYSLQRDGTPV